jgi:hypothetical protein
MQFPLINAKPKCMETSPKQSTQNFATEVCRKTRRVFTSEQKILIFIEEMRSELSVSANCREYGIANMVFYKRNKGFMEAGKNLKKKQIMKQKSIGIRRGVYLQYKLHSKTNPFLRNYYKRKFNS